MKQFSLVRSTLHLHLLLFLFLLVDRSEKCGKYERLIGS